MRLLDQKVKDLLNSGHLSVNVDGSVYSHRGRTNLLKPSKNHKGCEKFFIQDLHGNPMTVSSQRVISLARVRV